MPKVSVILTSFNHAKYIQEAIESTLNQTLTDFELIIWDDGSSDKSWELINQYSDPRIKAYRNTVNMGGVFGVNKAISEIATGEYIAIHHSDDVWELDKLEKQVDFLNNNQLLGAVFSNVSAIDESGETLNDQSHYYYNIFNQSNRSRHEWLRFFFVKGNALCHPSVLIRNQCYSDCGLYSNALVQLTDLDMWVRLCAKYEIYVMPDRLVKFRVRDEEMNASGSRPETRIRILYEYYKILQYYRTFKSSEDLFKIFPDFISYDRGENTDTEYVFAKVCLESETETAYLRNLLGIEILFDIVNNPSRRKAVENVYSFSLKDFFTITGQNNIFSQEEIVNLIVEHNGHIVHLNQAIGDLNQAIVYYKQAVVERDQRIIDLTQIAHDKEDHIGNLNQAIREREQQISNLIQAIDEIRGSTSWRLTRPIRFIGSQLLRVRIVFKALPYALIMSGGYRGLVKHVLDIYKSEGVNGIKRRILFSASPGTPAPVLDYTELNHNDYDEWVRRYDILDDHDREIINTQIKQMQRQPLISVLMPVYNPPLSMLEDAIRSVQGQLYQNWELCIADDASTDNDVHELLQQYAKNDSRIKVVFRDKNGHISAASNSALDLASGEYVALLDNDDMLREHALFWVAKTIISNPDAGLIYSDEDKIDQSGRRNDPYFKPDWNPDLFLSHNMICHLGVYRTGLVRELGGFRLGYEGAQDYDLALRCTEQLASQQIVHIPRVLYHWRSHPGSTAQAGSEKSYALLAGERALNDHFARVNVLAKAELLNFGMYRVRYAISTPAPLVSLIIPTRNGLDLIKQCIESILAKTTYKNYEILIVDNNSDDPNILDYFASLTAEDRIRILRDERPFNYSALNNAAVQQARGEYLGLINNDIEVISPEWLEEMMGLAIQPGIGAVGARLWYPNDTLQHGGVITGLGGVAGHSHKHLKKYIPGFFYRAQLIQTLSAVTAACLIVKKSIYQEVGGLDEANLAVAFNDVDFCLRVREAGYRNIWTPYAELYHHESATRGYEDTSEKQLRFRDEARYVKKRWGDMLVNDPAYNPNLTLDREDFSYAWPPRIKRI
ncbi:MAG TPA: glycosyltransferase [Methylobacter sp.]